MTRALIFWVIWLICVLVWLGVTFGGVGPTYGHYAGGGVIEFILFGLLGWQVFGPIVRG